jgi:hypothetical protein
MVADLENAWAGAGPSAGKKSHHERYDARLAGSGDSVRSDGKDGQERAGLARCWQITKLATSPFHPGLELLQLSDGRKAEIGHVEHVAESGMKQAEVI